MNAAWLMKVGRHDNYQAHPTSARHKIAKLDGARLRCGLRIISFNAACLSRLHNGSLPSKQEKVAIAKSAPVRQNDPAESPLYSISAAYASKPDRSAMGAVRREHNSVLRL